MTSGSADTQHLIEQVRSVAAGGPYAVTERPYGFDLTVDGADAEAASLIRTRAPDRVLTHQVRLDEEAHTLSISDASHRVRWNPTSADGFGEGRALVREAAEALGWREQRGRDRRIALAVAGIAVAGLLVAALITFVIRLAG